MCGAMIFFGEGASQFHKLKFLGFECRNARTHLLPARIDYRCIIHGCGVTGIHGTPGFIMFITNSQLVVSPWGVSPVCGSAMENSNTAQLPLSAGHLRGN